MNFPVIKGNIARRLLVNFRADPDVIQSKLPHPFRPKLHRGHAIVGVCLIHLENMKPAALPLPFGFSSENAAHRFAVLWDDADGNVQEGVFIPRRDTNSVVNTLIGGRLFPGQHHLASFHVRTTDSHIDLRMRSRDGKVEVRVDGQASSELPADSCFASLDEASDFFEGGALGYSVRDGSSCLDGLLLKPWKWQVQTLDVSEVYSSYYADEAQFPKGSVVYDHTLLMRDIKHEWHAAEELTTSPSHALPADPAVLA